MDGGASPSSRCDDLSGTSGGVDTGRGDAGGGAGVGESGIPKVVVAAPGRAHGMSSNPPPSQGPKPKTTSRAEGQSRDDAARLPPDIDVEDGVVCDDDTVRGDTEKVVTMVVHPTERDEHGAAGGHIDKVG